MLFVMVDQNRKQLGRLTQLLLAVFRGSVIYQHTEPMGALKDIRAHRVDAVFVGERINNMDGIEVMFLLRRNCPKLRVFILSEHENYCRSALEMGANGVLHWPLTERDIEEVLRTAG